MPYHCLDSTMFHLERMRGIDSSVSFLNRYRRDSVTWESGLIPESSQWSAGGKPSQASRPAHTALRSPLSPGQVTKISQTQPGRVETLKKKMELKKKKRAIIQCADILCLFFF